MRRQTLYRKLHTTAECPQCTAPMETTQHILRCTAPRARSTWAKSLTRMDAKLTQAKTDPALQRGIIQALRAWGSDSEFDYTALPPYMIEAFSEQASLGWFSFLLGFASPKWRLVQQRFFARNFKSRPPSIRRWTATLVSQALLVSWDMWEHRNAILHEASNVTRLNTLSAAIADQYRLGDMDSVFLRKYYRISLAELRSKPESYRAQWLNSVSSRRQALLTDPATLALHRQRALMHRHFGL